MSTTEATPVTVDAPATTTTTATDAATTKRVVHREQKAGLFFSVSAAENVLRTVMSAHDATVVAAAGESKDEEGKKIKKTKLSSTASVASAFVIESLLRSLIAMSSLQTGSRQTLYVRDLVAALTKADGHGVYAMLAQQIPLSVLADDPVTKPPTKRRRKKTKKEGEDAAPAGETETKSDDGADAPVAPEPQTGAQKLTQHVEELYVTCFGLAEGKTEATLPHSWMPGVKHAGVKDDGTNHRMTDAFRKTLIYLLACYLHRLAQNALTIIHTSTHTTVSHKHILAAASTAMPAAEVDAFMEIATGKVQTFLDNTVNKDKDEEGTVVTTTTATTTAV